MSYQLYDVPRLMCLLAGSMDVDDPEKVVEYVDAQRAWARLRRSEHRSMLWEVCANDRTMTSAAMRSGLYPARAKAALQEGAALLVYRLNNKEAQWATT